MNQTDQAVNNKLRELGIFFVVGVKHPDSKRSRKQEISNRRRARKAKRENLEFFARGVSCF